MEKLIELLNEYENEKNSDLYYKFELENWELYCYDDVTDVLWTMQDEAMVICSKQFWFIKWLVKNDKIDLWEKLFNLTKNDNRKSIICDLDNNDFSWEDTFLMLLAISNSPVEDLLLYLK